jgi:hypothetical protein
MADISGFNAATVQPTSFDVLPAGEYDAVIVASELKETTNGDGKYIKFEIQVLNGEYQNRKLWDNLNLWNPSDKAVQIARGTLSAICRAVGVLTPKDTAELHNKPLRVKVKVTKSEDYGEQNKIASYKSRQAGPPAGPAGTVAQRPQPAGQPAGSPWG